MTARLYSRLVLLFFLLCAFVCTKTESLRAEEQPIEVSPPVGLELTPDNLNLPQASAENLNSSRVPTEPIPTPEQLAAAEKAQQGTESSSPQPTESPPVVPSQEGNQVAASPEAIRLSRFKAAARKRLTRKFTNKDGTPAKVFILPPIDYTTLQVPAVVTDTITRNIKLYNPSFNVREGKFPLPSVTLEGFRKAIASLKADIIIVTVMYPTNFDLYLYDRRTPFQVYAHTEPIANAAQYDLSRDAASYYTKLLVRRTLYRFIKNQYYELPRDNSPPVLQAEIPRFIASQETLEKINREMRTNLYASTGIGAALSRGPNGRFWNSNLFGIQAGYNFYEKFYAELGFQMFAYNTLVASAKYLFSNKQDTFKLMGGIGVSMIADRKTLNWDQFDSVKPTAIFAVPSLTVLFPIVDVYLKAEGQAYIGINQRSVILTVMPGLFVMF
jgi:hypothetical protein